MSFSNLWKGLAVVAVLFLFSLEASAQLPVRTQNLQLINPAGGTLTHNVNTGAVTTSYTVTWPGNKFGADETDEAILIGSYANAGAFGAGDIDLRWEVSDGFVDGAGATNHVTFWSPDNNTLSAQEAFEFNPASGTFRVGVDLEANPLAPDNVEPGTAGVVQIGDGTNTPSIVMTGTTATATFGNGTIAGTVNVTNITGTNNAVLDGATGTATLGSAADDGVLVMNDGSGQTVTINPGAQTVNVPLTFDTPTAGPALPATTFYVTPATNVSDATTTDYILTANGDGTATWALNPAALLKSGTVTMPAVASPSITAGGANVYTATYTFATAYPGAIVPVVTLSYNHATNANIIQVTATTSATFTIASTAPLEVGDSFNYIAVAPNNP